MLTTTIGAYPRRADLPIGNASQDGETARDLLDRATIDVVKKQIELGIDIPTNGEIRREHAIRYHCRHLGGIDLEEQHHDEEGPSLATITSPVLAGPAFLVRDWQVAQSATRKPVKMTLPGPMTIGAGVHDGFYKEDAVTRGVALAEALNVEIGRLADAGCPVVQVNEPAFIQNPDAALVFGLELLDRCFHRVPRPTERVVHLCAGLPDELDADEAPSKTPPEAYAELATVLQDVAIDTIAIEDARRPKDLSLLERCTRTKVILGVIDVATSKVEEVEAVRSRLLQAQDHIDPHRLIAAPDRGLGLLGRDLAGRKLRVLADAAHSI